MQPPRDNFDAFCSILAGLADAAAAFLGVMVAVWIRFDSGWIPLHDQEILPPRIMYLAAAAVLAPLLVIIFRQVGLYIRPQLGPFGDKLPRIVRGVSITLGTALMLSFIVRPADWPPYSRTVALMSFFSVLLLVLLERFALFRIELHWARRTAPIRRILIIGVDDLAARLRRALEREPRLRSRLAGYVLPFEPGTRPITLAAAITPKLVKGHIGELESLIEEENIDDVILADMSISHKRLTEILFHCERNLIPFRMVPDLYRVLTSRVRVNHIGDIPLLGMAAWPLDAFWNRVLKRLEDIAGALVGLVLSAPILLLAAPLIKRSSPGPVFYRQVRCGIGGKEFTIFKLRTMPVDAENATGPVWATPDDPRRTRIGEFLRKWNLDELPQFWNVLVGDMSLVGPRPERPHFVEQFKNDVGHYMTRHVSRPGMTGWAQVNGLRGDTSIADRVQHDLYYLENWSLSFDLKILIQTFFNRQNAY
ncbi:MAG TPA: sugar transferase [Kiritimatiellia bacterium]|jgi:exopolysaccharide biosynthesis polyprenyl glycosylphosphotransferase|nr:sugar transferase [Kiritimatiellia bacterium]OQC56069.1 MAG: UDP-glucose:undecaprenyl-phosphate glucose-1-phosphate transferase [Verrucomicrobia bacterium ADurb.Bin018]MBP9571698.1 sugar transferase [Kiritimatiellia bacterium]HOE00103.1 sugar transferase [Kiritimatiellia bacterium]HOE37220.1 sugar transferase [Kiritimatiellia bacterium]